MPASLIVDLIGKLVWPTVILVILVGYRRALLGILERTRVLEGPGDFKLKLDPSKVEQIVEDGRREALPARAVANRIMEEAIVDERESRILRGLLGEKAGRLLLSYQRPPYRQALDALLQKGWVVRNNDGKFALTATGTKAVVSNLRPLLQASSDSDTVTNPGRSMT